VCQSFSRQLLLDVNADQHKRRGDQRPATNICFMDLANKPPNTAPTQGANTGTHEYHHSDGPFPGIGSIQWAILGAKSRAGFNAGPVVPPPHKISLHSESNKKQTNML